MALLRFVYFFRFDLYEGILEMAGGLGSGLVLDDEVVVAVGGGDLFDIEAAEVVAVRQDLRFEQAGQRGVAGVRRRRGEGLAGVPARQATDSLSTPQAGRRGADRPNL